MESLTLASPPSQFHLGPGPHPNGTPQSVHGGASRKLAPANDWDEERHEPQDVQYGSLAAKQARAKLIAQADEYEAIVQQRKAALNRCDATGLELQAALRRNAGPVEIATLKQRMESEWDEYLKAEDASATLLKQQGKFLLTGKLHNPIDGVIISSQDAPSKRKEVERALAELGRFYQRPITPQGQQLIIAVKSDVKRAFYNDHVINLGTGDGKAVTWHETGHHIESTDPEVHEAVFRFLMRRVDGKRDPAQKMDEIAPGQGYAADEVTRRDKFLHPYIGKDYDDNSTEVFSMGLERMHVNPLNLARGDPEMFDLVYDIAKNQSLEPWLSKRAHYHLGPGPHPNGSAQAVHGLDEFEDMDPQALELIEGYQRNSQRVALQQALPDVDPVTIDGMLESWNESANQEINSLRIQRAVARQQGFALSDYQLNTEAHARRGSDWPAGSDHDYDEMADAVYAATQADLKKAGLDSVTLFRGVRWTGDVKPERGDTVTAEINALSSWTADVRTAHSFGDVVLKTRVPRERVFSTVRTGPGTPSEYEFVLIGSEPLPAIVTYAQP